MLINGNRRNRRSRRTRRNGGNVAIVRHRNWYISFDEDSVELSITSAFRHWNKSQVLGMLHKCEVLPTRETEDGDINFRLRLKKRTKDGIEEVTVAYLNDYGNDLHEMSEAEEVEAVCAEVLEWCRSVELDDIANNYSLEEADEFLADLEPEKPAKPAPKTKSSSSARSAEAKKKAATAKKAANQ